MISTGKCNPLHHAAFTDNLYSLRGRLFLHAGAPWEGESADLKDALIQARNNWKELTGGDVPCSIEFDNEDLHETTALNKELNQASQGFESIQSNCGIGEEGWVATEDYEGAMTFLRSSRR